MPVLGFIHVPKTAGKSICAALGLHFGKHLRALEVEAQFKFVFVRHPIDRFLSAWTFMKTSSKRLPWVSANEMLESGNWIDGDMTLKPMSYWLDAPVDFIGRYEALPDDFIRLCSHIGMTTYPTLPHHHRRHIEHETLSEGSTRLLREIYAEDFSRFNYT